MTSDQLRGLLIEAGFEEDPFVVVGEWIMRLSPDYDDPEDDAPTIRVSWRHYAASVSANRRQGSTPSFDVRVGRASAEMAWDVVCAFLPPYGSLVVGND